jgi:tRNA-dihydrouridine synthase A
VNGGIETVADLDLHLTGMDGVMIGRAAYHGPMVLAAMHAHVFGAEAPDPRAVMADYTAYMAKELSEGGRLNDMTRHVLGLFAGRPGARRFRQILSDAHRLKANDLRLVDDALAALRPDHDAEAGDSALKRGALKRGALKRGMRRVGAA